MKKKLMNLRNTLNLVETKGNNTLIMADCLRFLEQCIAECEQVEVEAKSESKQEV